MHNYHDGLTRCVGDFSSDGRPMLPIPIGAAKNIAELYGYDQVVVFARRVGGSPQPHGEHLTTYGVNAGHCRVAALIGKFLKEKIMGWVKSDG